MTKTAPNGFPVPAHRDLSEYVRESQLLLWIWRMISEISSFDYEQYLRDGVILCHLIKHLAPDTVASMVADGGDSKRHKRVNIERFLDSCRAYGLAEEQLFEVEDLLSMQDIPRVTKCLYSLGKLAAEKFGQPELGVPYDEWIEQQITCVAKRSGMPLGDDLHVSHVDTEWLKRKLERRRAADAAAITKPAREPLVQRTPSKPLAELKALFSVTAAVDVSAKTTEAPAN